MIRKLKRKFVLINMAFVSLVLLIVLVGILATNIRQYQTQGDLALRTAVRWETGMSPARFPVGMPPEFTHEKPLEILPIFSVIIDGTGDFRVFAEHVDVPDELIEQAVSKAMLMEDGSGRIAALNLRYLKETHPMETRIAFLDQSLEQARLRSMMLTLSLAGFGSFGAFLMISLFLSGWALRPAEKAWAQQQQFIADASHELKTPLTVILANLGILDDHGDKTVASQSKWIENTRTEATRMKGLVDDLLFLARSDAGATRQIPCALSLTDITWQCVLAFEPVAYENDVTIENEIAADITVLGDESQMAQLVTILLDNACKYAGPHGVVSLSLAPHGEKHVRLRVHNTGEPIPEEALSDIFKRFYRADASRARSRGGYGLGLAIADQIVLQHRGRIDAQSGASGTIFTVTLPSYRHTQADPPPHFSIKN